MERVTPTETRERLWSDFSFVASSKYRERILVALAPAPKMPRQLARETHVRLTHVSRSLREMADHGLVECLTPDRKSHGRLYGLTPVGSLLVRFREESGRRFSPPPRVSADFELVPKVRASLAIAAIRYLSATLGSEKVRDVFANWSVDARGLSKDTWLSIDAADEFLEILVSEVGNGSYDYVRSLTSQVAPGVSSIQEQLMKAIPLRAVVELAPIVWNKEWNYGRLVVSNGGREARFQHFDWMPTPAFCAGAHGVYEGILLARGVDGTVTKTQCVRSGDECCEYQMRW